MNALTLERPVANFGFMRAQKPVGGRPLKGVERLSERLAPIYVTPTFKRQLDATLKEFNWDFAEFGRDALLSKVENSADENPRSGRVVIDIPESEIERLESIADQSVRTRDLSRFAEQLVRSMLDYDVATVKRIMSGQIAADLSAYEQLKAQISAVPMVAPQENISPLSRLSPKDEEHEKRVDEILQENAKVRHTKEQPAKRKAADAA